MSCFTSWRFSLWLRSASSHKHAQSLDRLVRDSGFTPAMKYQNMWKLLWAPSRLLEILPILLPSIKGISSLIKTPRPQYGTPSTKLSETSKILRAGYKRYFLAMIWVRLRLSSWEQETSWLIKLIKQFLCVFYSEKSSTVFNYWKTGS